MRRLDDSETGGCSTKESLWTIVGQQEVSGLNFYGYWSEGGPPQPSFPNQAWQVPIKVLPWRLVGEVWIVQMWSVQIIDEWPGPEEWPQVILRTLENITDRGAVVAWCSSEACFADPPSLFDPSEMSGCVYAAYSPAWGFKVAAGLEEPFASLSDSDLLELKALL